jgi:hypothetical protein
MAAGDCKQCVNYRPNSSFGLPACAATNMLLATHNDKDSPTIRDAHADQCNAFEPGPMAATNLQITAVRIGVNLDAGGASVDPNREKPVSCSSCKFYAAPRTVQKELGWAAGLCTKRGELIQHSAIQTCALACPFGDVGDNQLSTADVMLDPRYRGGLNTVKVGGKGSTVKGFDPLRHIQTDPREWETDRPVTQEDREAAIQAWRRVDDPKGKQSPKFMPVFDWKELGIDRDPRETYGGHTPHLYEDHAGLLYWFAFLYGGTWGDPARGDQGLQETLMLLGEAGTGKTEFWCYVAYLMDLPFTRLSIRPDTESMEFFGTGALVDSESGGQVTTFKPGRFTTAYQRPGVVCIDELTAANDSIMYLIRPVIDGAGQFAIEQEAMVFEQDPACFIGVACNPSWNPLYTGTRPLSAADDSRLNKRWVELPDEATERHIITAHCKAVGYDIDVKILDRLFRIAGDLREQYKNHDSTLPWGIRDQIKVAKLTWGLDMIDAFNTAVLDGMDPDQATMVRGVITAHS